MGFGYKQEDGYFVFSQLKNIPNFLSLITGKYVPRANAPVHPSLMDMYPKEVTSAGLQT